MTTPRTVLLLLLSFLLATVHSARAGTEVFDFDDLPFNHSLAASDVLNVSGGAVTTTQSPRSAPHALQLYGNDNSATASYAWFKVADVDIPIGPGTKLAYWVQPLWSNSGNVAVDLLFDDGSRLRTSTAVDQHGVGMDPAAQGAGGHLTLYQYNQVESLLGVYFDGRIIKEILVGYDRPAGTGWFNALFDDITISNIPAWSFDFDDLAHPTVLNVSSASGAAGTATTSTASPWSAPHALRVTGTDASATESFIVFDVADVNIPITPRMKLEYRLLPLAGTGASVAVDLILDDGTTLSDSGAVDVHNIPIHPADQGRAGHLNLGVWHRIEASIGACFRQRSIDRIVVRYDRPELTGAFDAQIDDIRLYDEADPPPLAPDGFVWIRGTKVDENGRPYAHADTGINALGAGSTCGPSYHQQPGTICAGAVNPWVTKAIVNSEGWMQLYARIPAGKGAVVSVCTDGTGYGGQYECNGHKTASFCRPPQAGGSLTSIKLWVLPNRQPSFIDVTWKYVPSSVLGWFRPCDAGGLPRVVATSSVPSGTRGDVDNDGFITQTDGIRALRCARGQAIGFPGSCMPKADFDQSGSVSAGDGEQILRVAEGRAVPTPSEVKPVYFVARDKEPDLCARPKLQSGVEMIRDFYGNEMERLGFGNKPFNSEFDANGRPRAYVIRGRRNQADYGERGSQNVFANINNELDEFFDADRSVYASVENDVGAFLGSRRAAHGGAGQVLGLMDYLTPSKAAMLDVLCDETLETRPFDVERPRGDAAQIVLGGYAHEVGHAFGAWHEHTFDGIMGTGNYSFGRYFVSCRGTPPTFWQRPLLLELHRAFRSATSYADNTAPMVTMNAPTSVAHGAPIPITFTVTDTHSAPALGVVRVGQVNWSLWLQDVDLRGQGQVVNGSYTYTPSPPSPPLDPGTYQIRVEGIDGDGNVSWTTRNVTITP